MDSPSAAQKLRFTLTVPEGGKLNLEVPFPAGKRIAVFIVPEDELETELMQASHSSLGFWDNPEDDADWNHALSEPRSR